MLPAEWIRQAEWIKIANIQFLITLKKIDVRLYNPTIFAVNLLCVKLCSHP